VTPVRITLMKSSSDHWLSLPPGVRFGAGGQSAGTPGIGPPDSPGP